MGEKLPPFEELLAVASQTKTLDASDLTLVKALAGGALQLLKGLEGIAARECKCTPQVSDPACLVCAAAAAIERANAEADHG